MYAITLRMPDEYEPQIEEAAQARGISRAELARRALESYLNLARIEMERWPKNSPAKVGQNPTKEY